METNPKVFEKLLLNQNVFDLLVIAHEEGKKHPTNTFRETLNGVKEYFGITGTKSYILKECKKSYESSGVQGAITKAEELGVKSYKYCKPCDANQPNIDDTCCVCGSATN